MEKQSYTILLKRLHYLQGQLIGIEKMLAQNRPIPDIFIQFLAIEGGVNKIIYRVLDEIIRKDIATRLNALQLTATCPETLAIVNEIRNEFPNYTLKRLPAIHRQLQ